MYVCMYVCTYVCMYVCMYVFFILFLSMLHYSWVILYADCTHYWLSCLEGKQRLSVLCRPFAIDQLPVMGRSDASRCLISISWFNFLIHTCMYVCMYVLLHMYVCIYGWMYICKNVCMYMRVCMYIYIYNIYIYMVGCRDVGIHMMCVNVFMWTFSFDYVDLSVNCVSG